MELAIIESDKLFEKKFFGLFFLNKKMKKYVENGNLLAFKTSMPYDDASRSLTARKIPYTHILPYDGKAAFNNDDMMECIEILDHRTVAKIHKLFSSSMDTKVIYMYPHITSSSYINYQIICGFKLFINIVDPRNEYALKTIIEALPQLFSDIEFDVVSNGTTYEITFSKADAKEKVIDYLLKKNKIKSFGIFSSRKDIRQLNR